VSGQPYLSPGSPRPTNAAAFLYNHPQYYDVAFSWDATAELEILEKLFRTHVPFRVKTVLEPACGTGRLMIGLARRGYRAVGYDASQTMAVYAKGQIERSGLSSHAFVAVGDMRSTRLRRPFDAALNAINSLGYLLTDAEVLAHLRNTGESLRPGGVYIVQLACAWERLPDGEDGVWTLERDGIQVRTTWLILAEDREKKLSRQLCRMNVEDHGIRFEVEEEHMLRLWFLEDLADLARRSGVFELAAVYHEDGRRVAPGVPVTGELGNLFHVLERV
jgi:SAM-dependent methyltransferase